MSSANWPRHSASDPSSNPCSVSSREGFLARQYVDGRVLGPLHVFSRHDDRRDQSELPGQAGVTHAVSEHHPRGFWGKADFLLAALVAMKGLRIFHEIVQAPHGTVVGAGIERARE